MKSTLEDGEESLMSPELSAGKTGCMRQKRVLFCLLLVLMVAFVQAIHFHLNFQDQCISQCPLCLAVHSPGIATVAQLALIHVPTVSGRVQLVEISANQQTKSFALDIRPPPAV